MKIALLHQIFETDKRRANAKGEQMPKFKIIWEFAGEEYEDIVERDSLETAEWQASDNLQALVRSRTAYRAEAIDDNGSD